MNKNYIPGVASAIRLYMQTYGKSESDMARELGVTQGAVNQVLRLGFGKTSAKKWSSTFGFNVSFLMTGVGSLMEENSFPIDNIPSENLVPLLPVLAHAGHLVDFADSVNDYDCEKVMSPIKDAEIAIPVTGESMQPEFPSGSIVFVKRINEKAFIEWGRTYVLDTINGCVIKYLSPGENGKVKCISVNPDPMYAPFEVSMSDIYGIYRVLSCLSMK